MGALIWTKVAQRKFNGSQLNKRETANIQQSYIYFGYKFASQVVCSDQCIKQKNVYPACQNIMWRRSLFKHAALIGLPKRDARND